MKALVTTTLGVLPLLWLTLSAFISAPTNPDAPTAAVAAEHVTPNACIPSCGAHGTCVNDHCLCRDGYTGSHCQIPPS